MLDATTNAIYEEKINYLVSILIRGRELIWVNFISCPTHLNVKQKYIFCNSAGNRDIFIAMRTIGQLNAKTLHKINISHVMKATIWNQSYEYLK